MTIFQNMACFDASRECIVWFERHPFRLRAWTVCFEILFDAKAVSNRSHSSLDRRFFRRSVLFNSCEVTTNHMKLMLSKNVIWAALSIEIAYRKSFVRYALRTNLFFRSTLRNFKKSSCSFVYLFENLKIELFGLSILRQLKKSMLFVHSHVPTKDLKLSSVPLKERSVDVRHGRN